MKKLLASIAIMCFAFFLTSCNDIREIVNEVENMIIEESLNQLTKEVGIEDFALPEYEDLDIDFEYDESKDVSKLDLEIEKPNCELDEYKDQLVGYVEEAISEYVDPETVDFEPTVVENGYVWEYTYEKELEDGTIKEVVVFVELFKDAEGDFELKLELTNLGDIFASIEEEIEEETNNQ